MHNMKPATPRLGTLSVPCLFLLPPPCLSPGLSRDGTLVILGISDDKIVLTPLQLIIGRKSIVGFLTGTGRDIQVGEGGGGVLK